MGVVSNFGKLESIAVVGLAAVAAYFVYRTLSGTAVGVGAVSDYVKDNVTDPLFDLINGPENPFSGDAEEQHFIDKTNWWLTKNGNAPLTNPEKWLVRGYAPSVALLGPAKAGKEHWYIPVDFWDCMYQAADEVIRRRNL